MPELYDEGRASATPLYDWQSDPTWGATVERRAVGSPQAARHGEGCECPRCPGWYVARERARVPSYSTAPPEQRPRPLVDQVIPVCCLLAMVAVCGLVLVPVVVPVLARLCELRARAGHTKTEVVSMDAELLGIESSADEHIASVKFDGTLRVDGQVERVSEVWNLSKPVRGGGWVLAGIQQLA